MKENLKNRNILLTGFEPFGKWPVNPTEVAALELNGLISNGIQVVGKVIPLRYSEIAEKLEEYVTALDPIAIVLTGQAGGPKVRLENTAKNFVKTGIPYNCGSEFTGNEIIVNGPEKLYTSLPFEKIVSDLSIDNVPVSNSDDAGSFGCNQIFYLARYLYPDIPSGFIHVPLLPEQIKNESDDFMPQEMISAILKLVVKQIVDYLD